MKFSMIFSAIDRSSRTIGKIIGNVDRLKGSTGKAVKASATAVKATAKGVVVAGGLMSAALAASADQAINFESAMADVNKVVEFNSPAGFEKFSNDILDLSTRIPVAAKGLAEISAEAGAAGIALEDNLRFTEFTAKSAVAFDFAAGRAGESFAKIRNVYQLSQTGIEGMADAVNHLSNNMASKAPEIVDFINRAGGAAPMLKASATQMAAIGSAMIATGTAPEVAARGITTLATKLEVGGSKVEGALKSVGLTHSGLMAQIEANPGEGLITLFEAIGNSPKGTEALKKLVGQDFVDDFAKITSRSDLLAASLKLVGDETDYAGSVQEEFNTRAATTANSIDLLKNNAAALAIEIGNEVLPALNMGLQKGIGFIRTIRDGTGNLKSSFQAITVWWTDFFSTLSAWGPAITDSFGGVGTAFSALGETIGRIFALFTGTDDLSGFGNVVGTVVAGAFNLLLIAVEGVANGLNFLLGTALEFWSNNGAKVQAWAATIGNALSAAQEVVASALGAIMGTVSRFWSAFSSTIGSWGTTIWESMQSVGSAFSELGNTISRIFALFSGSGGERATTFGHIVGTVVAGAFNLLLIAVEAVVEAINFLLTGVETFIKWFQGKEVDWSTLIPPIPEFDTAILKAGVDLLVGIVEKGWNLLSGIFGKIIAASGKLGDAVGSAIELAVDGAQAAMAAISGSSGVERIFDQLDAVAERGYRSDFVQGQALTEALAAGEISLDAYRSSLSAISVGHGEFATTAQAMIDKSLQLNDFKMPMQTAPEIPKIQDLDVVTAKISAIDAAALKLPTTVKGAVDKVHAFLGSVSLHRHGVRMMDTLAAGMRDGAHAVTNQIKSTMQDVRNHLPSSPAKVGPLSDIHRLKFGETIAMSIRAEPMVRAMRVAAAATMAAAGPMAPNAALANVATPASAAQSTLQSAAQSLAASAPSSTANSGGGGIGSTGSKTVTVSYGDIIIPGASAEDKASFGQMLREHRRDIKRLMEEEGDLADRTEF